MAAITDWKAITVEGEVMRRRELRPVDLADLPFDRVNGLVVETDHPGVPLVRVTVHPEKGDVARLPFTRNAAPMTGGPVRGVPVIEVVPAPGRAVRLYLTPEGPVLSTEDLFAV